MGSKDRVVLEKRVMWQKGGFYKGPIWKVAAEMYSQLPQVWVVALYEML